MLKQLFLKIMKKYQTLLFVGSTDILPEPLTKEEEISPLAYAQMQKATKLPQRVRKSKITSTNNLQSEW